MPSLGMPLNPVGQEQTGSDPDTEQIALGPQESGIAHGSQPDPPSVVEIRMIGGNGVTTRSVVDEMKLPIVDGVRVVVDRNLGES